MRRQRYRMLAAAMLALMAGPIGVGGAAGQAQCHGVDDLPRADGPIRSVRLRGFVPGAASVDYGDIILELVFTKWDVPGITFHTSAICGSDGRLLDCSIDCDGGAFVVMAEGSAALLEALGPVYFAQGAVAPFFSNGEPDAEGLRGLFRLQQMIGGDHCLPDPQAAGSILSAGDISPRVTEAERLLAGLGYHRELPDPLFDARTAEAVRAFQADFRLPVTGRIDAETALALSAVTVATGGC